MTGLVGAGVVVLLLLFLNSLLADLPQTALAAVIMAAGYSLIDISAIRRYWVVRRTALLVSVVTSASVILAGAYAPMVKLLDYRATSHVRRRQLQRRRPDAGLHPARGQTTVF